jgi:hypothetical protein
VLLTTGVAKSARTQITIRDQSCVTPAMAAQIQVVMHRGALWPGARAEGSTRTSVDATAALEERDTGERGQPVHQLVLESHRGGEHHERGRDDPRYDGVDGNPTRISATQGDGLQRAIGPR